MRPRAWSGFSSGCEGLRLNLPGRLDERREDEFFLSVITVSEVLHARHGEPIGAHDLWLAAGCVGRGMALITSNAREFARVPALELEVWGAPPPT